MSRPLLQAATSPARPRLLVLEFWGLGDLTFATPLLRAAAERFEITLVAKEYAAALLQPTFPDVHFVAFDAPWSAFQGKYQLLKWPWRTLWNLFRQLRNARFDAAVSVRNDPRDHFFMWLVGARRRFGFPINGSGRFLTHGLRHASWKQHKVEDWREIGRALGFPKISEIEPRLDHSRYHTEAVDLLLGARGKPSVCLHPGARIRVRRWPETYFSEIIQQLRARFDFHLVLIPDPDGYGAGLVPLADTVLRPLSIRELVDVLGRVDLVICNDSGPSHVAASCATPTIAVFGPGDPDWFSPWGDTQKVLIRDICPLRPCFDYCPFPEPYCLTRLLPNEVWPEVLEQIESLLSRGELPGELRRGA